MDFEPKVFRNIVFVRHGQYQKPPEQLTALGRRQAQSAALALKPLKPTKLYCSNMPRAIETARLMEQELKLEPVVKAFFREGLLPGTQGFYELLTKKSSKSEKTALKAKMKAAKVSADAAFRFLFQKPQSGQQTQVVVAHGNVIRHWVCKALKISEKKWLSMDVSHASLTTIRINQKGEMVLLGFSDNGHLPHQMRTYV